MPLDSVQTDCMHVGSNYFRNYQLHINIWIWNLASDILVKGIPSLTNTHINLVAKIHSCISLHTVYCRPSLHILETALSTLLLEILLNLPSIKESEGFNLRWFKVEGNALHCCSKPGQDVKNKRQRKPQIRESSYFTKNRRIIFWGNEQDVLRSHGTLSLTSNYFWWEHNEILQHFYQYIFQCTSQVQAGSHTTWTTGCLHI